MLSMFVSLAPAGCKTQASLLPLDCSRPAHEFRYIDSISVHVRCMLVYKRLASQHATIEKKALDVLLTTMTFRLLTTFLTLDVRSQGPAFRKSVIY